MTGDFHFLRPAWLFAVIPALLLAWAIHRHGDGMRAWKGIVAENLLPYLLRGSAAKRRGGPVLLLLAGWILAAIAAAGPAWKREPSPFAEDTAALAVVVKVSPSMMTEDVAPNRLVRSVQKLHDLLALRGGAKTALVAYAGTAHPVMPPTQDPAVVESFASALDPKIMPVEGDAAADALKVADGLLSEAGGGSILWITDGISADQRSALQAWRASSRTSVRVLAPLRDSPELQALRDSARRVDASVVALVADDSDVGRLASAAKFAPPRTAAGEGEGWQDSGYWLSLPLAVLMLPFFRKGWLPFIAARS